MEFFLYVVIIDAYILRSMTVRFTILLLPVLQDFVWYYWMINSVKNITQYGECVAEGCNVV